MLADRAAVAPRALPTLDRADTYVLAVDLGTGGPKAAVVSATGRIAAHAGRPVGLELTADGGAEQDPSAWWRAVVEAARQAVAESGVPVASIVGVGCTGQWLGTVAVGGDGAPLGPALVWMDSRGGAQTRALMKGRLPVMGYDVTRAPRWIQLSGGAPLLDGKDPVGHILFLRHHRPDLYAETAVFLEPVDYLNLRLTGRARASWDTVAGHWVTDNRSIDRVDYHPWLLGASSLERRRLPDLVPTATVLGGLSVEAAEELGLVAGTAVATGTGDVHSAAVGSGAVADFAGHLYIGTSSWVSCHVPFKKTSVRTNMASVPSALPGRYVVIDEHQTSGASLTWLRDSVLFAEPPADGEAALEELNRVAADVPPGAHGALFTPWLNGERSPVEDVTIRAGFHNLSLSTSRDDLVRAVFEGVALNNRWLLGAVERFCGRPFPSLAFVGGGARSALWAQLHADVMGRPIRQVADPVLANVRGAALVTLLALGRVTTAELGEAVPLTAEYRPDPAAAAVYDDLAAEFVHLYRRTKGIHRRLNARKLGSV